MTAMISGTTVHGTSYELYGDAAQVVVLIHGLGLNKTMWWNQIQALQKNHRVLIYDLTGMGSSSPPTKTPDLTMFARQLAELLDELEIRKAVIAGFSLGGMIARRFTMDYPDRVSGLAVLNSAYKRDKAAHDAIQARVYQAEKEGPNATVEAALSRWFTKSYQLENPEVMDWVRETILSNDREIYPRNYQVLVDGVDEVSAPNPPISCPTLVMTGEEDYGNSVEMARQISSEIENATTVILPGLRHMAMVEAPQQFNNELLKFLDGLSEGVSNV